MSSIKKCDAGIWAAIATGFLIIIYAPLETLFSNKNEFCFDLQLLLPYMLLTLAILLFPVCMIIICVEKKSRTLYKVLTIASFVILLDFYIQGNFFVKNLPSLDGTLIDWSLYPGERIKSIIIIVILVVLAVAASKILGTDKLVSTIKYLSMGITCFLLITILMLAISTQGYRSKSQYTCTGHGMETFSTDLNFIIFVLDATDGQCMKDLIESDEHYAGIFKDFTFYTDTMGMYSFTEHSVPYILSGDTYENDEDFNEYLDKAYTGEKSIVRRLYDQGYDVGVYETDMQISGDNYAFIDNVMAYKKGVTDPIAFIRWNIQMGGFRYFPFDVKRICFVSPAAFLSIMKIPDGESIFEHDNRDYYEELISREVSVTDKKCFKYTRILGSHVPWKYDEDLNDKEDAQYTDQMRSGLKVTEEYLDRLKSAGCYDDSIIIIMADHGYDTVGTDTMKRTNPILFIKGINEVHDIVVMNDERVSFEDLQRAYDDLLNGKQSTDLFNDIDPDRVRRYIYYEYLDEDHMYEYLQTGDARSWDTLTETGNRYFR